MSKFVIETAIRENYVLYNDDWDGVSAYWKNKGGNTYIVEAETVQEAKTVIPLVTDSSNAFEENFLISLSVTMILNLSFLNLKKSMTLMMGNSLC